MLLSVSQFPPMAFTEDYQLQFHANYFDTFDEYRSKFLIGELIWNFADFMTDQGEPRRRPAVSYITFHC